jgi:CPA1 family monovalent cation:H+ antiporter
MDQLIGKTIGMLVVASLVAIAARRLRLPYTVGLVVTGMSLALSHIDVGIALTHDIIFDAILPPLLFEAALNLRWSDIRRDAGPIMLLSIGGVVVSAAVTFFCMHAALGWPVAAALVFAVLIAATDPVAVIALFKDLGVVGRVRVLVESESLFNDGVAAVLFAFALTWVSQEPDSGLPWLSLVTMTGGGLLIGLAVGLAALLLVGRTGDHLVETGVTVAAAYGSFLLAEVLRCSGVLATVAAGLVVGAVGMRAKQRKLGLSHHGRVFALEFWEFLAFLANSTVFLLIGVTISRIHFAAIGYLTIALTILIVLVSRATSVYPLSLLLRNSARKIAMKEQHVLFWGGLRGALALALALALPATLVYRSEVVVATFAVVAFSVVVQGLTMPALLRLLGMRTSVRAPAT